MLCLDTERSAHTSQTNWTLGVRNAQAQYALPSVSAPLDEDQVESQELWAERHRAQQTQIRKSCNQQLQMLQSCLYCVFTEKESVDIKISVCNEASYKSLHFSTNS